jgi:type IV pilus assembly protein PilM
MFSLSNKTVGLTIDDRSLEIVELKKSGARARVLSFSRKILPRGLVINGVLQNGPALATLVQSALNEAKPQAIKTKKIVFALPENQSYFLTASLPQVEGDDADKLIKSIVSENIPLESRDIAFDYELIQKSKQISEIFLRASSQKVLATWRDFFLDLGLEIEVFDTEFFALARDLVLLDSKAPVCLIDIGAIKTNLAIWQNGIIYYSATLIVGGNFFTKAIADKFKVTLVTAERKKMQLGLSQQIFPLISGQLRAVANEAEAAIAYYQDSYGVAVKEVVLLGGSSRLKGLTEFFQEALGLPVGLGKLKSLIEKFPLEYFGAIGAAWRGLNIKRFKTQVDFNYLIEQGLRKIKPKLEPIMINKIIKPTTVTDNDSDEDEILSTIAKPDSEDLANLEVEEDDLLVAKINKEKKVLLLVLVLGVGLLLGAFWYRNQEKNKQAAKMNQYQGASYDQVQTLNFKLPVAIGVTSSANGEISGRIIETIISSGTNYDGVLTEGKTKAKYNLKDNEALWEEPLNEIIDRNKLVFPMTLRWLAYSQKEAMKLALVKIDEANTIKAEYSFNKLEVKGLEKTDKADLLYILVDITISSNQKISTGGQPLTTSEPTQATQTLMASSTNATSEVMATTSQPLNTGTQVLILNTETGWLNIREGPGATFDIVKKINPGEIYGFLEKQGDWTKIKLSDTEVGWGASRYMRQQ